MRGRGSAVQTQMVCWREVMRAARLLSRLGLRSWVKLLSHRQRRATAESCESLETRALRTRLGGLSRAQYALKA